jgi:hypothetical protein
VGAPGAGDRDGHHGDRGGRETRCDRAAECADQHAVADVAGNLRVAERVHPGPRRQQLFEGEDHDDVRG